MKKIMKKDFTKKWSGYVVLCFAFTLGCLLLFVPYKTAEMDGIDLRTELERYISSHDAEIGVGIIIDSRDTLCINNETAYPLNSVMKLFQAIAVVDEMHRRQIPLETELALTADDLHADTHSPLRDSLGVSDSSMMSIAELLRYSLQYSDNNACDILFRYLLDIASVDMYIRELGIGDFSLSVNENGMHKAHERAVENWAQPDAAAALIDRLYTDSAEITPYRQFVSGILDACSTGQNRLANPLQGTETVIGHKTGTGFDDSDGYPQGINDVGFIRLPGDRHYAIAVFVKSSHYDMAGTEQIIADISEIVWRHLIVN